MTNSETRMGPFRWLATTIAEKLADVLLGGDILDPGRDGSEVDWGDLENTMTRTVTAELPRIQLELALLAAERKADGGFQKEEVQKLIANAMELGEDESLESKTGEDCHLTLIGKESADLELKMTGKGRLFETLRNEIWDRAKTMKTEVEGNSRTANSRELS